MAPHNVAGVRYLVRWSVAPFFSCSLHLSSHFFSHAPCPLCTGQRRAFIAPPA